MGASYCRGEGMEIGKKGAFFTFIALMMVSILFILAQTQYINRMQQESFVIHKRISSVDYFIEDLERDIERGMYIAAHRSLLGMQQHITSRGNFVNDTDDAFTQIILNGTYNGTYLSVMNNSELKTWFEKINYEADKLSIDIGYEINNLTVYHLNPWEIAIELDAVLNVTDKQGVAQWIRRTPLRANLSIIDFEDPLYNAKTSGRVVNVIKPTNITNFVEGNDTSGLLEHINRQLYTESNSSPSYLMRLSGNLNSSPHGIESFVDLRRFDDIGISTKDKSCIDYVYFSEMYPESWNIEHTYNWLKIDNRSNRVSRYQVEDLLI